jgi:hypothetical protein
MAHTKVEKTEVVPKVVPTVERSAWEAFTTPTSVRVDIGARWHEVCVSATTRPRPTGSPPSLSCFHPRRPTSYPLNHVIGFKIVLPSIQL